MADLSHVIEDFLPNVLTNAVKVLPKDVIRREYEDVRQVVALAIVSVAHKPFKNAGQRYCLFLQAAKWDLINAFLRPRCVRRNETRIPEGHDSPYEITDRAALRDMFDYATSSLDPRRRFAIRMQFREGLESQEMADLIGMTPKMYSKAIYRPAIRRMREVCA